MPSPKPPNPRSRRRRYADRATLRPATSAAAYRWPCPRCDCTRNLRGLLREVCSHCTHVHHPPPTEETPC